jgi:hypothetical protein
MSLPERILSRIEKTDTCWLWRGAIKENGYGKTSWEGKPAYSHRVVYTQLVGPIPEGLEIDHLCKVRNCVRPEHLRVTDRSGNNSNRTLKTHCKNGHELVGDNVAIRGDNGGRRCRACTRETGRRWTQASRDRAGLARQKPRARKRVFAVVHAGFPRGPQAGSERDVNVV